MNKPIQLKKAVEYYDGRVDISNIDKNSFVTTDNLLQNKGGIASAMNLPPQTGTIPAFKKNLILVSNIRPYLKKIWYADKDGGCSADILVFKTITAFDSKFVYYSLFRDDFFAHMMKGAKGTKMPRGDKKQVLYFLIPDFDYSNQQKIASVLSSLDDKIALNNRINAKLEGMAKTIYDYWFVQFDFPDPSTSSGRAGKPYKTSGGKMVWNEELKREVPEGWVVKKLGELLDTSLGGTPSTTEKKYWENGTIHWLNSSEIANFPIIGSELKITNEAIKYSSTDLLPKGSVVLSITRHLRPSILGIDACANQSVVGIKEKGHIKCYFLYPYLQNEIPRLMSLRSGAQQPHINKETVDKSLILLPDQSTSILESYNTTVGTLYELIINNAFENQTLSSLRDWLLPMLMNGQVTVK